MKYKAIAMMKNNEEEGDHSNSSKANSYMKPYHTHDAYYKYIKNKTNKVGPGSYNIGKGFEKSQNAVSFPKARLGRDSSVDKVLHNKVKTIRKRQRPTICDNFDDDFIESESNEDATEIPKTEDKMLINDQLSRKESQVDIESKNNYSWIFRDNESVINVNKSVGDYSKAETMYRSSKSKRSNNMHNISFIENYPTFTERVRERQQNNKSLPRSSSIDNKSSESQDLKAKINFIKNNSSSFKSSGRDYINKNNTNPTPAPGEYDVKGCFSLEKSNKEENFNPYEKNSTIKQKNPISFLYDKDEQIPSHPGPGQYNLPSSFQSNIKDKLINSKVNQLNLIEMLKINRSSNFKSKTKRIYQIQAENGAPGVGSYTIPRLLEEQKNQNANNYYRQNTLPKVPFMFNEKRFKAKNSSETRRRPGPGEYNNEIHNMDEKTWKVLNSENLRNYVKITVSHKKLINAGFIRNNRAIYNNSEELRFASNERDKSLNVGPGIYDIGTTEWIKKSYNVKFV